MDAALLAGVGALGVIVGPGLHAVVVRTARCPTVARRRLAGRALVTAVTAALFVLVSWRLQQLDQRAAVPAYLVFVAAGVVVSAVDLAVRRLPNRIVLPCYPVLVALLAVATVLRHDLPALGRSVLAAVALFGCFAVLALISPNGMGFGDVKLAGVIGAITGYMSWSALVVAAGAAFILGAIAGLVVVTAGGTRTTALPFGPFLVAGALLALWIAVPASRLLPAG